MFSNWYPVPIPECLDLNFFMQDALASDVSMKELTSRSRVETLFATFGRRKGVPKETRETFSDGGAGISRLMLHTRLGRGNRIDDIEKKARVDFAVSYVRLQSVLAVFVEISTLLFCEATALWTIPVTGIG